MRSKLQALVYDILLWRKVPESDARSVSAPLSHVIPNVHMVLNVHKNRKEGRGYGGGEVIKYLSLHCHHQNDLCIKVGSDESHFNVS